MYIIYIIYIIILTNANIYSPTPIKQPPLLGGQYQSPDEAFSIVFISIKRAAPFKQPLSIAQRVAV